MLTVGVWCVSLKLKDKDMIKFIKNLFSKRDKCTIHSVSNSFCSCTNYHYATWETQTDKWTCDCCGKTCNGHNDC